MTSVFLLPLIALVVLRFLEGELTGWGLTARLGPLLALQVGLSTELTFTIGLAIACAVALVFVVDPGRRRRAVALAGPLLGGGALAAALTAPFLYYAFTGFQSAQLHWPDGFVADLANLVVPTRLEAAGAWWSSADFRHFTGNDSERVAYLGLPTLVIAAWLGVQRWRSPGARFLIASIALVTIAASGSRLRVDQRRLIPGPWGLLESYPPFNNVLPVRLMVYASLAAAVIVAIWAAASSAPRWLRTALPVLAVLALVPYPAAGAWATTVHLPSFITAGTYRACLRQGENILPLPISDNGNSMLWQVRSGFWFRMAGGYISDGPPPSFMEPASVATIANKLPVPAAEPQIVAAYVRLEHVTSIVVDERASAGWRPVLDRLGPPQAVGGVLIYRVGGAWVPAGCGSAGERPVQAVLGGA